MRERSLASAKLALSGATQSPPARASDPDLSILKTLDSAEFYSSGPFFSILLGRAIRAQRQKLGLSQEKLAECCNFDRTYISMLERGKRNPSFLNLLKLAEGLETSVSKLTEVYDGTEPTR